MEKKLFFKLFIFAVIAEFVTVTSCGPAEVPGPESTSYDVIIYQQDQSIIAEIVDGEQIATSPISSDAASLFKAAVNAVSDGGSLHIGAGQYSLSAPYSFALNPDGTNIYYSAIQILDKDMHISGDGADKTILQLLPGQRSPSRHVAMMLIRGTRLNPGYDEFSVTDLTLDGNRASQTDGQPYDGEGLILVGSGRTNGYYHKLNLINSWGSGIYLGYNGSGIRYSGTNEMVSEVVARNCGAEGIMFDTCHHSTVIDCECWQCREGVVLNGNDDWQTRGSDNVTARRIKTDSQMTCWQVNDFVLDQVEMDCTNAPNSLGLVVRDGNGVVKNSILKNDKTKASSLGGATYFYEGARVLLQSCQIEGYFGIHAIGRSYAEANNCLIVAPGGCYCTTDPSPVSSTIVAKSCTWSGKKCDIQEGSSFLEM
jgi:hypothetical protein